MDKCEDRMGSIADFVEKICQMDKVVGAMVLPFFTVVFFLFSLTAFACLAVDEIKKLFAK